MNIISLLCVPAQKSKAYNRAILSLHVAIKLLLTEWPKIQMSVQNIQWDGKKQKWMKPRAHYTKHFVRGQTYAWAKFFAQATAGVCFVHPIQYHWHSKEISPLQSEDKWTSSIPLLLKRCWMLCIYLPWSQSVFDVLLLHARSLFRSCPWELHSSGLGMSEFPVAMLWPHITETCVV